MNGDPLSREACAAVDPQNMLGDVLDQPNQVTDALWRVESAQIPTTDCSGGLTICGMGGSAIGGELAAGALGDRATRPIRTVRGFGLEPGTGTDVLVLCASYSGETEETLACFEAASAIGAPRVALTTGGRLAEAARAEGVPVIGIPSGLQPRAAVVYMTVAALECAAAGGAASSVREEIDGSCDALSTLVGEWGPDSPPDSDAKRIAAALAGKLPVIHGAGPTSAAARRWKTQLNENAEQPAFFSELPEAGHNEICGWERGNGIAPLAGVFLEDPDQHPRLRGTLEASAGVIAEAGAAVERVESRGATPVERTLSLVLLGDLVSVYAAVLAGVDPTPVQAIERLKSASA